MHAHGPFDGVMGFSEGAVLATMLLVEDARRPFGNFRCGILFSAALPLDPDIVMSPGGEGLAPLRCLHPSIDGIVVNVPTVHVWSNVMTGWRRRVA